jgi:hypothetical protein
VDLVSPLAPVERDALPAGVAIRRAGPADAAAVADLDAGLRHHLEASPIFLRPGPPPPVEVARKRLQDEAVATFLAERDGAAVAFLRIGPCATDVATMVRDPGTASITGAYTRRRGGVAPAGGGGRLGRGGRLRPVGGGPRVGERGGVALLGPPRDPRDDLAEPPAGARSRPLIPRPPHLPATRPCYPPRRWRSWA